jgi:hypothetical protein
MWDDRVLAAIATGLRAAADELDRQVTPKTLEAGVPEAGSRQSMQIVLSSFAAINDDENRGATPEDARRIAASAGMDTRGLAGYFRAGLLASRSGTRWLTDKGRDRLRRLNAGEE